MPSIRHLVLDVLKPHQPNTLEFALALARLDSGYRVQVEVSEVDEHTETLVVTLDGESLDFEQITAAIEKNGGSLHSIDEVVAHGE